MSQTVQRAIAILEFVSEAPRSLGEVAEHLDVHKSTALRLLQTLVDGGLVRRGEDGAYGVGYRLAGLAQVALDQFDLRAIAHPHLVALGKLTRHTVHFAALEDDRIVYVDKIDPVGAVRLYSQIGKPVRLHTAGAGKAVLAFLPADREAALLRDHEFERFTDTTITSAAAFQQELAEIRERGWAIDNGEFEDFVNCIAVPVRGATGAVFAAVSVTALKAQADLTDLQRLLPDLRHTADTISKELGCPS
jgi:DNA-binding IclR family transcriptional regulator